MKFKHLFAAAFALLFIGSQQVYAAQATVAVAANFTKAIEEIGEEFTKQTGHTLKFSFGPTGKLYAQVKNGAPFDMLFSADSKTPKTALAEGFGVADSYFVYAQGALILYSPTLKVKDNAMEILQAANYRHLSIANPKTAPYGTQAEIFLKNIKAYDVNKSKIVNGESIAHAFQFVSTGNAELGFVALSQVIMPSSPVYQKGEYWMVPQDSYEPIEQAAVLFKRAEKNPAAIEFMDFVKNSPIAIEIIKKYGYKLPQ